MSQRRGHSPPSLAQQKLRTQQLGKQGSPQRRQQRKEEGYQYYLNKDSPNKRSIAETMAPSRQEQLFFEAKKVLDKHINYLTKACYYFFRDSIAKRDDSCIQILRDFNHHEDSDTLIKRCTDHYNKVVGRTVDRDYSNPYGGSSKYGNSSKSPVRTTSANVASQKRLMDSIEKDRQYR